MPPGAPTSVGVKLSGAVVTVSWKAPKFTAASKPTGYRVDSSPAGFGCTTTGTSCKVTLPVGLQTSFTVSASNAAGFGLPSDATSPVSVVVKPAAPTQVLVYPWNWGGIVRVLWQPA